MKKLIFLCLATTIVLFSVIVLNLAPVINNLINALIPPSPLKYNYNEACKKLVDRYNYHEKLSLDELKTAVSGISDSDDRKEYLDLLKEGKNKCYRDKAMIGLEYAAFNINVVFGATCSILGLLFYLEAANNKGKVIGIIGLITGVVGFALTFVYVIEAGIVITSDVIGKSYTSLSGTYSNSELRIDSDGAFLKWDGGKQSYVCIYYDKDNKDSLYQKFSHYGNKYFGYLKDINNAQEEKNWKYVSPGCFRSVSGINFEKCKKIDNNEDKIVEVSYTDNNGDVKGKCDKLFMPRSDTHFQNYERKNQYNKVITAYVFSVFIVILHLGLAIFGFLLFNDSGNSSSGPVTIQ